MSAEDHATFSAVTGAGAAQAQHFLDVAGGDVNVGGSYSRFTIALRILCRELTENIFQK